jgi:hypothetical protein
MWQQFNTKASKLSNPDLDPVYYSLHRSSADIVRAHSHDFRQLAPHLSPNCSEALDDDWLQITSIATYVVRLRNKRTEVIMGASDGAVYTFRNTGGAPIYRTECLFGPIVGLAVLPWIDAGQQYVVVISGKGTCCLLKSRKIVFMFVSPGFRIHGLYGDVEQRLLVMDRIDRAFTVYNIGEPAPLGRITVLPSGCAVIWRLNSFDMSNDNSGTHVFRVGSSGIYFNTLNVRDPTSANDAMLVHRFMTQKATAPEDFSSVLAGNHSGVTLFYQLYRLYGWALTNVPRGGPPSTIFCTSSCRPLSGSKRRPFARKRSIPRAISKWS